MPRLLTESSLSLGLSHLADADADLALILENCGRPPLWAREPGFSTMVHVILEQQVSLASARAAYDRLLRLASPLGPESFLTLGDEDLRRIGFSRQKAAYCRQLAASIQEGLIDLGALERMDDEAVRGELTRVKGIGPWTAEVYLLMAMRRPDAWPAGDLGLIVAAQRVKNLPARPRPQELSEMAEAWRPWRAVAARLLWHYYLSGMPRLDGD